MTKFSMKPFLFFALLGVVATNGFAKDERLDELSDEHRKWLEEEVVYIITDMEREVFLSIDTLEERQHLIEAFWRKRDPNRAAALNEFKEEHYRRIDYANKFLGRETFRPGWKTDRGRYYIILGEPREIQRFEGYMELLSTHLWFYEGDVSKGIPAFFYLMFFQRNDVGEYRLYHPMVDGPGQLLRGRLGQTPDNNAAIEALGQISPELARASLSYDTSDPADYMVGRASIGTDIMLARIDESPKRAIRTDYANAWLRYGDKVSAEYSFNFVPSRSVFTVLYAPEMTPFVHYSVEFDPQNFTMELDEEQNKYYTTLDVSVAATDPEGKVILATDKELYLELTQSEMEKVGAFPVAIQDDFPLIPGEYRVSVILRNRVLQQYTVAERSLKIEAIEAEKPALSDLLVGVHSITDDSQEGELRTFQIGNLRIHPAPEGTFPLGETADALVQVLNAGPDYEIRFALLNGEEVLQERSAKLSDYQGGLVFERFPLIRMVGGNYVLRAELVAPSGEVAAQSSAALQVSPRASIPRPAFVSRNSFNVNVPGLLPLARGEQLLAQGHDEQARAELEKAVAADNPMLPMARWKLAGLMVNEGKADRVLDLLSPLEERFPNQFEVMAGLGFAYFLKNDYAKAASYLDRATKLRLPDTNLLNALAFSYQQTGNPARAKEIFERSLKLDPNQSRVQKQLASLNEGEGGK